MRRKRTNTRKSPAPRSPSPEVYFSPVAARETPRSKVINKKKMKRTVGGGGFSSASHFLELKASPSPKINDGWRNLSTIADLKDFVSSRLEDIKRNLVDRSHNEILKDLEGSQSRLHKRFKIQTQSCQQVMDEAERECRKMSEWITGNHEAMKASYTDFMEEARSNTRVCKTSIEELSKSFNKKLDDLRSHFGISAT